MPCVYTNSTSGFICSHDRTFINQLKTDHGGERAYSSQSFYSTLWFLFTLLIVLIAVAVYAIYKLGRMPPPDKRPTEEQRQQAMWNNVKLPVQPFDKKIIPQFFFLFLAMLFKMTFLLLVANMLLYEMDEIYLYGVFVA